MTRLCKLHQTALNEMKGGVNEYGNHYYYRRYFLDFVGRPY